MKRCIDENELMRLWAADPAEFPDLRDHLGQCPRCAAGYGQLGRDAATIANALTVAADHLKWRGRTVTDGAINRLGGRIRTAVIFSGAAAFGGAAAFALMLALGWHPARRADNPAAPANTEVAEAEADTALLNSGSLYAVDAIASDPLAGLADGSGAQAANSEAGGDLLFCVPEDDGVICDSSAQQG